MANIEPLRVFQAEDLPWFLKVKRSMILYEPRMGKTVEVCHILASDDECEVILIACSKNALGVWMDHLESWFKVLAPNKTIDIRVVRGKGGTAAASRQEIYKRLRTADVTIYLTTFNALINDWPFLESFKSLRFDTLIGDEVHTKLKNRKTKSAEIFRKITKSVKRFHPLSGTLAGKWGPADFWALLNMISPHEFSSYWAFVNTFCHVVEGPFGMEIIGVKNVHNWHLLLARYARIRDRATHASQMPKVERSLLWVDMLPGQRKLYEAMDKTMVTFTDSSKLIVAANSLEQFMVKRQLLTCPAIIDPKLGVGGAMEDLLDKMQEAKELGDEAGYHIAIFTAFRSALPHFESILQANGFSVQLLYGGLEPEDLALRIAKFRESKGVIICTTKFAQAFSLVPATQCFHIGYEHDPNENKQAEDRLVPQSGPNNINSWYYSYRETDDIFMAERTIIKHEIIQVTSTRPEGMEYYHANTNPRA